ncbi:MAG: CBS domain-containing protein [Pirellulales bacterium]|nr:CBS domain-containing protein [Pirellulales bacterium]
MKTLADILAAKGAAVHAIGPDAPVETAAQTLVQHNVGSLVVCAPEEPDGPILGILTERDLLRHYAATGCAGRAAPVAQLMTREVLTGSPGDPIELVMGVMTQRRIRHLPVVAEGKLVGIVSIGDVVKAQSDHLALENQLIKDYIQRR